jgi:hypothetical protein
MIFKADCKTFSNLEIKELLRRSNDITVVQVYEGYQKILVNPSKDELKDMGELEDVDIWNEALNFCLHHFLKITSFPLQNPIKNVIKSPT